MTEDKKQQVDTSSTGFKAGVEAGLNSPEDTKNWKAGNKLGQELKAEGQSKGPLFMRDGQEGSMGNAQDEKDEAAE